MKVGIVIQARMGSSRLPGKVLRLLAGKPLLQYLLESVGECRRPTTRIVATSSAPEDDAIADFCRARGLQCFRGDPLDVASRFRAVTAEHGLDAVARLSGDSPLLDPRLVERGIMLFEDQAPDLVTNVFPRSFPPGQSVEVFAAAAFARAWGMMAEPDDHEHVTRVFYRYPLRFAIRNFAAAEDLSGVDLAVDTAADFRRIERLVEGLERPHWQVGYRDLARRYRELDG